MYYKGDKYYMSKNIIYKAEDIFQDIEGDNNNVLMTIPPEIREKMGWEEGDLLKVKVLDEGGISIEKVDNGQD